MDVKLSTAVQAYTQAAAKAKDAVGGSPAPDASKQICAEFSTMVKDVVGSAVQAGKSAETMSLQAISGTADISQVALAVTNAEMSLQTVVAVRDRVIQAYQDILKMPI